MFTLFFTLCSVESLKVSIPVSFAIIFGHNSWNVSEICLSVIVCASKRCGLTDIFFIRIMKVWLDEMYSFLQFVHNEGNSP